MRVFIGYDSTQSIASDVLVYSIRKHCENQDLHIYLLKLTELQEKGFYRPHDPLQSTEFTYTRFLIPWICNYRGTALFLDSDMLALADFSELFQLDMESYALRVVKHDYRPFRKTKMGGKVQTLYPRKNWSSLMLMDCSKLTEWTKENVETRSGAWLHRFEPVSDREIGEIDGVLWNTLDYYDETTKLIHYTEGGPWLPGCEDHTYGDIWKEYKMNMLSRNFKPEEQTQSISEL